MKARTRRYGHLLDQVSPIRVAIALLLLGTLAYVAEPAISQADILSVAKSEAATEGLSTNSSTEEREASARSREEFFRHLERTQERDISERLYIATSLLIVLVLFIFHVISKADRYGIRVKVAPTDVEVSLDGESRPRNREQPADASSRHRHSSVLERAGGIFLGLGIPVLLCSIWISGEAGIQGWVPLTLYIVSVVWLVAGTMLLLLSTMANSRRGAEEQADQMDRREHSRSAESGSILITREAPRKPITTGIYQNVSRGGLYAKVPKDDSINIGDSIRIENEFGSKLAIGYEPNEPINARVTHIKAETSDSDGAECLGIGVVFESPPKITVS